LTPLQKHLDSEVRDRFLQNEPLVKILLRPAQSAANSVWAAVAKEWEDKGGVYFENLQREVFVTEQGYAEIGSCWARSGDEIVIGLGGAPPLGLREHEQR